MRSEFHTGDALTLAAGFALGATVTWLACAGQERLQSPGPTSDEVLAQRVLERIGELLSQPHQVSVQVEQGEVRISGQAPAQERDALLSSLVYMPGVFRVRNALSRTSARE